VQEKQEEAQGNIEDDEEDKESEMAKTVMVFTSTCRTAELIHEMLKQLGIQAASLHSGLTQTERMKSLDAFKSGFRRVLVATDVASRGLDIPIVEFVINYDFPRNVEDYIHRVGRTARAGRGGKAVTLITQYDVKKIVAIEELIGKKLTEMETDEETVLRHLNETTAAKILAAANMKGDAFDQSFNKKKIKTAKMEETNPHQYPKF